MIRASSSIHIRENTASSHAVEEIFLERDVVGHRERCGKSRRLVLEGVLVISVLVIPLMGTQLPTSIIFARLAPGDLLIAALWLVGLWLINKAHNGLP